MRVTTVGEPGAETSPVGRALGEFVVGERLGGGGFGDVYRARQRTLGRDAVVKILHARHLASDVTVHRFLREGQLASQLDHPYAAHIYACGAEPDGLLWIAMELVRGTPLDKLLQASGAIPLDRCLGLLERLCEVVASAHEQGIVHRDIKPANVMVLSRAGTLLPKLLDLGIATRRGEEPERVRTGSVSIDGLADTATPDAERLTSNSVVVGTPLYMAPELWTGGAAVDQRADLYALGVLAYQCLSGRLPFHAPDIATLARAHREADVPSLGRELPDALDAVLRQALAKRPEDRFASALELGAAMRAAVAPATVERALPVLAPSTVARVLAVAPRPIVDVIVAIQRARTLQQVRLAIGRAVRAIVRYLNVLALAARARMDRETVPLDEALPLLRELRRRRLGDREAIQLIGALCIDVVELRDAFALPELVDFAIGTIPGRDTLSALAKATAEPLGTDDEHAQLAGLLRDLATLLDDLQFLDAYRLVVGTESGAECWMGITRDPASLSRAPPQGHALLFAGDGEAVLDFGPLVRVASPLPGTPADVFVFDGPSGKRATLHAASGFELVDDRIWDWLAENLLATEAAATTASQEHSPYRGLATFTQADAGLFCGRERELVGFRNRMRVHPLLAVVGASGAGKSSFVLAGVLADAATEWQSIVIRPGHAPLAALAAVLPGAPDAGDLARDPELAGKLLRAAADKRGQILVVDQLEELFTLCTDDVARRAFAAALASAARTIEEPVRVVVTLRDDFLVRTQALPELRERIAHGLFLLATPTDDDLVRIVAEPCARAGYEFDDPQLPVRMVAEVAGRPAALALLSFTAARLWELRDRHFHLLRVSAYQTTGGVAGALAAHADTVFEALSHDEQRFAREAFRHLVTADNTRAVLARGDLIKLSGGTERTIEKLVAARLLAISEGADGGELVELVHEALITGWPRLDAWRRSDEVAARLRDQLREAVKQWTARNRATGLLWRDDALAELERWRAGYPGVLTDAEEAFVAASRAAAKRTRGRRRIALIVAFAALVTALVVVGWSNARTARERDRAEQSTARERTEKARALFENGRRASLAGDERTAIRDIATALELGHDSVGARLVLGNALEDLRHRIAVLRGHTGQVSTIASSPDGRLLATGSSDKTVRIWDVQTGAQLRVLQNPGHVWRIQFAADNRRLLACGYGGFATIWDLAAGAPKPVRAGSDIVLDCRFLAGDARIATAASSGEVQIWDATTGALVHALPGHKEPWNLLFVGELADGTLVTAEDTDSTIRIWDRDGRRTAELRAADNIESVALGPDGTLVTAGAARHVLQFWSIPKRQLLGELAAHTSPVIALRFSRAGDLLLSASTDGTAHVWSVERRERVANLAGATHANDARFSADDASVVLASSDGARVFAARTGRIRARLHGHENAVWTAGFVGERVVTASWDHTVQLWRVGTGALIAEHPLGDLEGFAPQIAVAPDGGRLATGRRGGAVVFDARTGRLEHELPTGTDEIPVSIAISARTEIAAVNGIGELAVFTRDGRRHAVRTLDTQRELSRRLELSPDGSRLASAAALGRAEIFEMPGLRPVRSLTETTAPDTGRTSMLAWSPRGAVATASAAGKVDIWNPDLQRVSSIDTAATALALRDDMLATGDAAGTITVWDARTGTRVATLSEHHNMIFSLLWSGENLVSASADGTLRTWKPGTGTTSSASMRGHSAQVVTADTSPDGWFVASGSWDDTLRIWDLAEGVELVRINAHAGDVVAVRWIGNDRIGTIGGDGQLRIWRLVVDRRPVAALVAEARCLLAAEDCSALTPDSTPR